MKTAKKLAAAIIAVILVFSATSGAFALSVEGGIEPIKGLFEASEGPVTNGY